MTSFLKRSVLPATVIFLGADIFFMGSALFHGHLLGGLIDAGFGLLDFEVLRRAAKKQGYL